MEIDSKIKSAFDLVLKLQPDRPRLLTPIPQSFIPFWEHSYNVLKNVLQMGFSEEETILASILHDVLEDTEYTEQDMSTEYGEKVLSIVKAVTKPKEFNKENESKYFEGIFLHPNLEVRKSACVIKLADRIDNLLGVAITCNQLHATAYLEQTKKYFGEMAKVINKEEVFENLIKQSEFLKKSKK
jgi:(p)ppGpp synthase/HD superfamily hydrolase